MRIRPAAPFWSLLIHLLLLISGGKAAGAAQEHVLLPSVASRNQATNTAEPAPYLTPETPLRDVALVRSGKEVKAPRVQAEPETSLPSLGGCLVRLQEDVASRRECRLTTLVECSVIQRQATRAPPMRPSSKLSLAEEHIP